MGLATFKGGIHTYDGKELSKDKPTTILMPKGDLVYPMSQHIGAPAKPIVAVGDRVLVGQKIAEAGGFISACVISSVSGTVKAIEKRLIASGAKVDSIVVENDGAYETVPGFGEVCDPAKLSKEEIRNKIKEAGIVGMGGAGFPNHVKVTPKDDSKIEYVIVNAAECEPYLTSDYRMMLEEPERLIGGLKILLSLFENAKGVIGIEDNKPEAVEKLKSVIGSDSKIEVKLLKTKYPQGAEKQLIYATTGRSLNSRMLPSDVGCVVDNVATVIAIQLAVAENTPCIQRVVTVTGDAVKDPRNFNVRTGTNYTEILEAAGGLTCKPEKIVSGGPMMGMAIYTTDIPVTKTSSALLCMSKDDVAAFDTTACIRCGRCVDVCACHLVPQKMYQAAVVQKDLDAFVALNGMECYECGSCSYVCPAKIRLTQAFKVARKSVMDSRKK